MADEKIVYRAPPADETSRRVYVLPVELVKLIHAYGFRHGHQSEVSAVRELLELGLNSSAPRNGGDDGKA